MNRNLLTAASLTLAAGAAATVATGCKSSKTASQDAKPNVVIILGDDVGFGDIACNGSRATIATPNIDRLAATGVRFTNAHSTSSVSTPARFAMLTGLYPWRVEGTGIATGDAGMIIPPGSFTLATLMQNAGYATGAVGKWHLGIGERGKQDWNGTVTPGLETIGFDYSFIMAATGDRVPCVYIENGKVYNYDPSAPISVSYETPFEGEPLGSTHPELLRLHPSLGHNQAIVDGIPRIGYMKGGGRALWHDEDIAMDITAKALEFIGANAGKPFFLYFGTNDIHVPRVPNELFAGKSGMGPRGDAILSFDWTVGRVLDKLEELGIADNTIIILTSDNGPVVDDGYADRAVELLGDHRPWAVYRGGKYSIYEAGTRVPFITRFPGFPGGKTSDALVSQIDLVASLGAMTGVAIPVGAAPDSENMLGALRGCDPRGRDNVVEQNNTGAISILEGDWKYIPASQGRTISENTDVETGHSPSPQLYNVKSDPGERRNIAAENAGKVADLAAKLEAVKEQK